MTNMTGTIPAPDQGPPPLDTYHAMQLATIQGCLELLQGIPYHDESQGLVLQPNETVLISGPGELFQIKAQRGHYVGGYAGTSLKVTKNARVHLGGSRGTYVPGPDAPTLLDTGLFHITTRRAVFVGLKKVIEWPWPKVTMVRFHGDDYSVALGVSNRQSLHIVRYNKLWNHLIQCAIAYAQGRSDEQIELITNAGTLLLAEMAERNLVQLPAENNVPPLGPSRTAAMELAASIKRDTAPDPVPKPKKKTKRKILLFLFLAYLAIMAISGLLKAEDQSDSQPKSPFETKLTTEPWTVSRTASSANAQSTFRGAL